MTPPATRARRLSSCLRSFFTHLFSNVGLFSLVGGYVLLGALLFESLEGGYEMNQRGSMKGHRDDCLRELWALTERFNVLYQENWTQQAQEQLRRFETRVVEATKVEGYDGKDPQDQDRQWSFSGALLYSVTVITTIGYGNLAPRTPEGKVVTMLYALVGVPLMLLCLSNLGSFLADTFQFAYSHACCRPCRDGHGDVHGDGHGQKQQLQQEPQRVGYNGFGDGSVYYSSAGGAGGVPLDWSQPFRDREREQELHNTVVKTANNRGGQVVTRLQPKHPAHLTPDVHNCGPHSTPSRVPLLCRSNSASGMTGVDPGAMAQSTPLVLTGLAAYICLGAAVFAAWEEWSFLDGAYFCFVTLSTIGFGDLVPGKSLKSAESQGGQLQVSACVAYLLLGLVLIATAFSLVQEEVLARLSQVARTLGIISKHHQPLHHHHHHGLHHQGRRHSARHHAASQTSATATAQTHHHSRRRSDPT
ncbi:potassium channel subfamily K member 3-like [Thrips palmi]|uniref:Potassium channel subfamily K member 3-like n=1 Tax=Thrips palmi TaxID=161013 RepID=A0A6P9AHR7_THRPL|nr:potassium channel subfamily K member 3-like [Thrips palmi]